MAFKRGPKKKVPTEDDQAPQKLWPYPPIPPETQDLVGRAFAEAYKHHMTEAGVKSFVTFIQKGHQPEEYLGKGKKVKKTKGKALAGVVRTVGALVGKRGSGLLRAVGLSANGKAGAKSHQVQGLGKVLARLGAGFRNAVGKNRSNAPMPVRRAGGPFDVTQGGPLVFPAPLGRHPENPGVDCACCRHPGPVGAGL